jgi:hypothetical protein
LAIPPLRLHNAGSINVCMHACIDVCFDNYSGHTHIYRETQERKNNKTNVKGIKNNIIILLLSTTLLRRHGVDGRVCRYGEKMRSKRHTYQQ